MRTFGWIGLLSLVVAVFCMGSFPESGSKENGGNAVISQQGTAPRTETKGPKQDLAPPTGGWVHPFALPQVEKFPEELLAVVEIPQGSFTKYEIDPTSGYVAVDRFQSMPVVYPANYGVITSTLAGDGDNLDVLILTREPVVPGAIIRIRPVGILRMLDDGEEDDKVIAVPTSKLDPTYDSILTISDLPKIEVERIEAFFRVYKQLPQGRKIVELNGFLDAEEAKVLIKKAVTDYQEANQSALTTGK